MIEVEERIPDIDLWKATAQGGERVGTGEYFAGRKILLFGLPGAFTPTCSEIHLPGYIAKAEALRAAGVDAIACVAVNDPYVMAAWGDAAGRPARSICSPTATANWRAPSGSRSTAPRAASAGAAGASRR